MRLLLLRHGQTPANVEGLLDTAHPGPGLTTLGDRQAAAVPEALRDRQVDAIAVSPLVRTARTAAPLARARGIEPLMVDGLQEVEAGELEMAGDHESHLRYLGTVFAWARGEVGRVMPGGPDGRAFLGRYDGAVAAIAARGWDSVVVVSHGAAIRAWVSARVAGVDVDHVERTALANTGLVEIDGDPVGGWRLVAWSAGPVGGLELDAPAADDPTGEPVED
ncbi:putative phosphoglycerate mutase [Promicromonospora umidemergens]|uniref:Histidine phosphatase family protein n=1 Tax=Promicromonospora umidemergens TaxID=629679 RepID=A0ABP8X9G1_9MICO|nr:histidine phosphatase family protein [Promicromonospora umidemergens]MCP2281553.1 putative phosphoglycerate mutase [Promicromonospora umidemergens]